MHRTFALSTYMRHHFGQRVQKIPLDAGFSCPNRDGTLSKLGCVFCNPLGSGSGMRERGLSLAEQWAFWRDIHLGTHGIERYTAYLQSYSNTYGPVEKLAETLTALDGLPGLTTLALGTRPDCLDAEKLDLLVEQKKALGLAEVVLELGLQSSNDATLTHINRGHDAATFAEAVHAAAERGLLVVAHVMAGLPTQNGREGVDELLDTVRYVNALPVHGIKFHNLYVCRGTVLARWFKAGTYVPMTRDEFLDALSEAIQCLDPKIVIHRLNGNPQKGELLAPDWAANMRGMHNAIRAHFKEHDIWQGKKNGAESGPPEWFSPSFEG
ncbi:TIGR01212 family radical SAM protein [Pseudodesulfovibrio sp. JC047]|uniref:TIGR01212 family radical SAM protein n=1 Tax=Pseudodesulfovibrio sp. JC047 TaxID=2683199 RepID=UPI0013D34C58|nr:TIGR01212 family radical SAM protein [Pseudodesulfovibrio sp. JC047]NDV20102.1 TIGR01212 family radical SAM protein [Pseudodesulfovibrio sp. JC047]